MGKPDDDNNVLSQLVQDLYLRLARAGLTPQLDSKLPVAEQYVQLQELVFREITERKQIEDEKSRLSEQRQLALDAAHLGWWHYDPETKMASYDQRYREIFDVTGSERPNEEILARIHPDDLPGVWAKVEAALDPDNPKSYVAEYRVLRSDGSLCWVEAHGLAAFAGEGSARHAVSFVGTVADITERKRAEQSIVEGRTKLEAALASMTDAVFISDAEGRFIDFNEAFATFHKFHSKAECAMTFAEYPDILDVFFDNGELAPVEQWAVPRALRGETATDTVYLLHRKDTGESWVGSYSFAPIHANDGAIVGSVVVARDITEFRNAQHELLELNRTLEQRVYDRTEQLAVMLAREQTIRAEAESARSRFQGLLESAPDSIVIVDAAGKITLVNTQLEQLTGYTRDELLGMTVELLLPERYRQLHVRQRADYHAAPYIRAMGVGLELFIRGKAGDETPVEISLSPFTTSGGTLVIAIIRDITARKAAEAEITRLNAALQHNVEQLTLANKEMEAFSYSVSHDLRAPLRSIDGFSKVLQEQYPAVLDARGRDFLQRVRAAAQRMNRLIDDMLHLSRIGRAEMRRAPVDLSDLAAGVIDDLRQRDPERQVEVIISPGLRVYGDAGLLRIVFDNLLGNAWKFTGHRDQARIEVGATTHEDERVYFVRDNGAGFDMAYADKLFAPFQRLHTEDEFPGTGIGLAIVQRIIARHGGRIWAEGEEGVGATVYFTLGEKE